MDQLETEVPEIGADDFKGAAALAAAHLEKANTTPPDAPANPEVAPVESGKSDKLPEGLDEQTLKEFREGKLIPKHRFDEEIGKRQTLEQRVKQYESFGSPEDLKAKLDKIVSDAKGGAIPPSPVKTDVELSQEEKEMRDFILKTNPELAKYPQIQQTVENLMNKLNEVTAEREAEKSAEYARQESAYNAHIENATGEIKKMATEVGIAADDAEVLGLIVNGVVNLLESEKNKELYDAFYNKRDMSVLKKVFTDYTQKILSGAQKKAAANILSNKKLGAKLPKAPAAGGVPPAEGEDKPAEDWKEARSRANVIMTQ